VRSHAVPVTLVMRLGASFPDQIDLDQPLLRVGNVAAVGATQRDGDSARRPCLKRLLALRRGMDFPLLSFAGAGDAAAALCYRPGRALSHGHS